MRKFLMGLTILAGAFAMTPGVHAAPRFANPVRAASGQPAVQSVQYFGDRDDWRYREWRRREAFERYRRHEAWRHQRREAHERYHEHYRYGW